MKADDARRQTHGRYATLLRQPSHGRFAHLQNLSELLGGQEFFAIGHFGVPRLDGALD
jgi:hypothetical protein